MQMTTRKRMGGQQSSGLHSALTHRAEMLRTIAHLIPDTSAIFICAQF